MSFSIAHVDAPLGHEIRGVDLTRLSDADFQRIESAYDQYGVIVIRDQHLAPEDQIAFSKRFGPLTEYIDGRYNMAQHPEIFMVSNEIREGREVGLADAGRYWHTDMWVTANPPRGSILYAIAVPHDEQGEPLGDTYFASTSAAYDALPDDLRARIHGKRALFSSEAYHSARLARTPRDPVTGELPREQQEREQRRRKNVTQEHPLVKIHPRSGRKCIYFSEEAIERIVGVSDEESAEILEAVHQHVLQPQFVYRHRWRVGDLVMWDNISCLHKATGDFEYPKIRTMHRTTLVNTMPAVAA